MLRQDGGMSGALPNACPFLGRAARTNVTSTSRATSSSLASRVGGGRRRRRRFCDFRRCIRLKSMFFSGNGCVLVYLSRACVVVMQGEPSLEAGRLPLCCRGGVLSVPRRPTPI